MPRPPAYFVYVGGAPGHLASGRPISDQDVVHRHELDLDSEDGPGADQQLVDSRRLLPTTKPRPTAEATTPEVPSP